MKNEQAHEKTQEHFIIYNLEGTISGKSISAELEF